MSEPATPLRRTPLHSRHLAAGARMAEFAGFDMPLTFAGAIAEHSHTRVSCSLFDVSHMLVCDVAGLETASSIERLTPSQVTDLGVGQSRYLVLTNERGGVIDDSVVTGLADGFRFVFNAARAEVDVAHFEENLGDCVRPRPDLGIVALQGPSAAVVLDRLGVGTSHLGFMESTAERISGVAVELSRSGYTGEDGFEITAHVDDLDDVAALLLADELVEPAGLAARDSLRLEAGLCLYGDDLDEDTTPVEARLTWTIPRSRREDGGFLGADRVREQLREGADQVRVGIKPQGRRIVRAGTVLHGPDGVVAGIVTSGAWGATVDGPVAMAYVSAGFAVTGVPLLADLRGTEVRCDIVDLPFIPHKYLRRKAA